MNKTFLYSPLFLFVMTLLLSAPTFGQLAYQKNITPHREGWINALHGKWSIGEPEILGVRNRGEENVWATYLGFRMPPIAPTSIELTLQRTEKRDNRQTFFLYGLKGIDWRPETLEGKNAPGWDPEENDVSSRVFLLATAQNNPASTELSFSKSEEFLEFIKKYPGEEITFIIVASQGSCKFHSSEATGGLGPKLMVSIDSDK
jgi:hypothetical protein